MLHSIYAFFFSLTAILVLNYPAAYGLTQDSGPDHDQSKGAISAVVDPVAKNLVERGVSVGLVVGVMLGEETWVHGYGSRSLTDAKAPDGETLYEIASLGKNFTAMLVFDAIARGELAMDDPVQKHLPDGMRVPVGKRPITIADLLDHRSGLPSNAPSLVPDTQAVWKAYDLKTLKRDLARTRLLFDPGTDVRYSNYGYGVLGLALHSATGLDYDELMRRRMTGPLGMSSTWQTLPPDKYARLVPGYDASGGVHTPLQLDALQGCGGMISCVNDMLIHLRAICEVDPAISAGCGFFFRLFGIEADWAALPPNAKTASGGMSWGYKSSFIIYPRRRLAVVILANCNAFEIDDVTKELAISLLPLAPPAIEAGGSPPNLGAFQDQPELQNPLADQFDELAPELLEDNRVPGAAVAVLRKGRLAWTRGYGFANREKMIPVTDATVFNVASVSKSVAAWGFMRLVEQGRLDLDQPVETYLTRWKVPRSRFSSDGVTLRRILSHTAGLSVPSVNSVPVGRILPSLSKWLSGQGAPEPVRLFMEPGKEWHYSGGGYAIAQLLVEEVSGLSFERYMREAILEPLGMNSSGFTWTQGFLASAATPYDRHGRKISHAHYTVSSAGGFQTTVVDLALFAKANLPAFAEPDSKSVLRPETIALMQRPVKVETNPLEYGLGFFNLTFPRGSDRIRTTGHDGGDHGWVAEMLFVPSTGDGLITLTNGSGGDPVTVAFREAWLKTIVLHPVPSENAIQTRR